MKGDEGGMLTLESKGGVEHEGYPLHQGGFLSNQADLA